MTKIIIALLIYMVAVGYLIIQGVVSAYRLAGDDGVWIFIALIFVCGTGRGSK